MGDGENGVRSVQATLMFRQAPGSSPVCAGAKNSLKDEGDMRVQSCAACPWALLMQDPITMEAHMVLGPGASAASRAPAVLCRNVNLQV